MTDKKKAAPKVEEPVVEDKPEDKPEVEEETPDEVEPEEKDVELDATAVDYFLSGDLERFKAAVHDKVVSTVKRELSM